MKCLPNERKLFAPPPKQKFHVNQFAEQHEGKAS
jgi:hypothetical protein